MTNINIPDKVTALYGTFYGCSSLQNITLSKNLSIIDDNTFYGCSKLTEIVLPKSITKIGSYSLYTYDSIVIYYEGDLESWNKIEILEDSKIEPELIYFYSETQPSDEGNYWHYDIDGLNPLQW